MRRCRRYPMTSEHAFEDSSVAANQVFRARLGDVIWDEALCPASEPGSLDVRKREVVMSKLLLRRSVARAATLSQAAGVAAYQRASWSTDFVPRLDKLLLTTTMTTTSTISGPARHGSTKPPS
jgi:hypothetical protein